MLLALFTILFLVGIRFSLFTPYSQFSNNRSAIQCSDFVGQAISDPLVTASVVEYECAPTVGTTLVSFIQLEFWKKNVCNLNSSVLQTLLADHLVSCNQMLAQLDALLFCH